jgi:hypothetical protein
MSTITQIKEVVQQILGPRADELARETQFVRRKRKVSGSDFVQGLVFGYLHQPDACSDDLIEMLERRGVQISAAGLSQRFTQEAEALLQRVMQEMMQVRIQAEQPAPVEILQRFEAVIVEDSSTITLPDELFERWPGCGGGPKQSRAGLKLHVRWDAETGRTDRSLAHPQSSRRSKRCAATRGHWPGGAQHHR